MSKSKPSLTKMAKNAASAAVRVVKHLVTDGSVLIEEEESSQRMGICKNCEMITPDHVQCTHEDCGCYLQEHLGIPGKTELITESCPLLKWPGDVEKAMLNPED